MVHVAYERKGGFGLAILVMKKQVADGVRLKRQAMLFAFSRDDFHDALLIKGSRRCAG